MLHMAICFYIIHISLTQQFDYDALMFSSDLFCLEFVELFESVGVQFLFIW